MQNNLTATDILAILKKDGLDGYFKTLKIGLSQTDRDAMAIKVKDLVLPLLNFGRPVEVPTFNDLPKDGGNGIYITADNGHYYTWNGNSWDDNGEFINNQAIEDLENGKRDNATIYTSDDEPFRTAMKGITTSKDFYKYFYNLKGGTIDTWQINFNSTDVANLGYNFDNLKTALKMPTFDSDRATLFVKRVNVTNEDNNKSGFMLELYLLTFGLGIMQKAVMGGQRNANGDIPTTIGTWQDLKGNNVTYKVPEQGADFNLIAPIDGQKTMYYPNCKKMVNGPVGIPPEKCDGALLVIEYDNTFFAQMFFYMNTDLTSAIYYRQSTAKETSGAFRFSAWVKIADSRGLVLDAADLLQMIETPSDGLIADLSEKGDKLHIHLDNNVDVEVPMNVIVPSLPQQNVTLDGAQLETLKGIRVFIEFPFNGATALITQDIRFTTKSNATTFVAVPLPDPSQSAWFSEAVFLKYEKGNNRLYLESTAGSLNAGIKIVDVVGIK